MDFHSLKRLIELSGYNQELLKDKGYQFKKSELIDFVNFVNRIMVHSSISVTDLMIFSDNFTFGYSIPHIGKEFDLIRLGENYNINIELKRKSNIEKQKTQLIRNNFYTKALEKRTIHFSIDLSTDEVWYLQENQLVKTDYSLLVKCIAQQETDKLRINIDSFFSPEKFLVSPFNETTKFLERNYFLTPQQINIKKDILEQESLDKTFVNGIEGVPGTGKSLILFDIALEQTRKHGQEQVVIVHSGSLNQGHLIMKNNNLNIIDAISSNSTFNEMSNFKWIFIDEAQRIFESQLSIIYDYALKNKSKLIISYDPEQTFEKSSNGEQNKNKIEKYINGTEGKQYFLTKKIRSNKKLAMFIKQLFAFEKSNVQKIDNETKHISVKYLDSEEYLKDYIKHLKTQNYEVLGYTPSKYNPDIYDKYANLKKPHDIIGQEFDKVAVIIDNSFSYIKDEDSNKYFLRSAYGQSFYSGQKMLYQNITRVRSSLEIVIINNEEVFNNIINLLNYL